MTFRLLKPPSCHLQKPYRNWERSQDSDSPPFRLQDRHSRPQSSESQARRRLEPPLLVPEHSARRKVPGPAVQPESLPSPLDVALGSARCNAGTFHSSPPRPLARSPEPCRADTRIQTSPEELRVPEVAAVRMVPRDCSQDLPVFAVAAARQLPVRADAICISGNSPSSPTHCQERGSSPHSGDIEIRSTCRCKPGNHKLNRSRPSYRTRHTPFNRPDAAVWAGCVSDLGVAEVARLQFVAVSEYPTAKRHPKNRRRTTSVSAAHSSPLAPLDPTRASGDRRRRLAAEETRPATSLPRA